MRRGEREERWWEGTREGGGEWMVRAKVSLGQGVRRELNSGAAGCCSQSPVAG